MENSRILEITRSDLEAILEHCRSGLPNEACGILAGKEGVVVRVYPMRNARPTPVSYEMDTAEQFQILKNVREEGLSLVGIFHSHPASPAYPSGIDVKKAYWPGTLFPNYPEAVYVIVSLLDLQPVIKGFSIMEGSIREVPLRIDRAPRP